MSEDPSNQAGYDFSKHVPHHHSLETNLITVLRFAKDHQQWEAECSNLANDLHTHKAVADPNSIREMHSLNALYLRIVALFGKHKAIKNEKQARLM